MNTNNDYQGRSPEQVKNMLTAGSVPGLMFLAAVAILFAYGIFKVVVKYAF